MVNSPEKERELFYNQLSHVTFMCPMRFNKFPFDRCKQTKICTKKEAQTKNESDRFNDNEVQKIPP